MISNKTKTTTTTNTVTFFVYFLRFCLSGPHTQTVQEAVELI